MLLDELLNFAFDKGFGFVFHILHKIYIKFALQLGRDAFRRLTCSSAACFSATCGAFASSCDLQGVSKEKKNQLGKAKRFNKGNEHVKTTKDKAVARLRSVSVNDSKECGRLLLELTARKFSAAVEANGISAASDSVSEFVF